MPRKKKEEVKKSPFSVNDPAGGNTDLIRPAKSTPTKQVTVTSERVILIALNKVMQEVGYVQKQSKVQYGNTKYNYASEAELLATLRPSMVAVGLVFVPSVHSIIPRGSDGNTYVEMKYMLGHISGAVWPYELKAWGCGGDKGDKGLYKAITGANKYMLFKLFQIETGNDPVFPAGDDPEVSEQSNADVMVPKVKHDLNAQEAVMTHIMGKYGGATEMDRAKRLDMVNGFLYFQKETAVTSYENVTNDQWIKMLTQI